LVKITRESVAGLFSPPMSQSLMPEAAADAEERSQHLQAIAEGIQLAAVLPDPVHGHLAP
jgi:hypothetical protein